jgi:hypothetical protein
MYFFLNLIIYIYIVDDAINCIRKFLNRIYICG